MPIPHAIGTLTQSEIRLQERYDQPALTLKAGRFQNDHIEIELSGKTFLDARSLIHAILALCPSAMDQKNDLKR